MKIRLSRLSKYFLQSYVWSKVFNCNFIKQYNIIDISCFRKMGYIIFGKSYKLKLPIFKIIWVKQFYWENIWELSQRWQTCLCLLPKWILLSRKRKIYFILFYLFASSISVKKSSFRRQRGFGKANVLPATSVQYRLPALHI